MASIEENFYTLTEVISRLKLGYIPLLRLIKSGQIKAIKIGGGWRISDRELSRFLRDEESLHL